MPASHSGLRRMYRHLNKKFWNNELPDLEVVWEPSDDAMAITHTYNQEARRITFDPALKGYNKVIKMAMLHEQIHVKYPTIKHGKKFKAEVKRLFDLGAYDKLL